MYGRTQQQHDSYSNYGSTNAGDNSREQYSGAGNAPRDYYARSGNAPRDSYSRPGNAPRDSSARDNYSGSGNAPRDNYSGSGSHASYAGGDNYTRSAPEPWAQQAPPVASKALSDLDMELEVMKRKRQMIQEQRQMLEEQQQLERLKVAAVSPWENQRQFEPRLPQNQLPNFASLYLPNPAPVTQRGTKRPARPQPWTTQPQAKRFAAAPAPSRPQVLPQLLNQNTSFAPLSGPRPARARAPLFQGKLPGAPGRINSKLDRELERDVGPVVPPAWPASKQVEMPIFRGIESVSRSVLGRFETVIGGLTKEIKTTFEASPHNVFFSNTATKALKQKLRERIHKMHTNKPVPLTGDIATTYRKLHPAKGDQRLVTAVMNLTDDENGTRTPAYPPASGAAPSSATQRPNAPTMPQTKTPNMPTEGLKKPAQAQSGTSKKPAQAQASVPQKAAPFKQPEDPAITYIKHNINQALSDKLDEMFQKLSNIYAEEDSDKKEPSDPENADKSLKISDEPAAEKIDTAVADAKATNEAKSTVVTAPEEFKLPAGVTIKTEEPITATATGEAPPMTEEERLVNLYERTLEFTIKRKLVKYLPKYKNFFITLIGRDRRFSKFEIEAPKELVPIERRQPLHFVKIFGKPSLPPRQKMQAFLGEFKPASVKKHKNVYNLLFVGVRDLESHERLLEKTNCLIGDSRLIIRDSPANKEILALPTQDIAQVPAELPEVVEDFAEDVKIPGELAQVGENEEVTGRDVQENGETVKATGKIEEATGEKEKAPVKDVLTEAIGDLDTDIDDLLTSVNEAGVADQNGAVHVEDEDGQEKAENERGDSKKVADDAGDSKEVANDAGDSMEAENEGGDSIEAEKEGGDSKEAEKEGDSKEAEKEEGQAEKNTPPTPASSARPRRSRRI